MFVKPIADFNGNAFLNYNISDEFGSTATGHLVLNINSTATSADTLTYYVTNTNSLSFVAVEGTYELAGDPPILGEFDNTASPELIYTPFVDSIGVDIFRLANNGDTIVIIVNVIESDINSNLVIDDKVFTSKQTPVSFNVSSNDFKRTVSSLHILNHSMVRLFIQVRGTLHTHLIQDFMALMNLHIPGN